MDTFRTSSARTPREAPRVGDYRRGSRVRTTKAGTWFPALGTVDEPAGLLLLHPAVKPAVLKAVIKRLAELRLPGVLPMLPGLVDQAGRNWLVATTAPTPTVADLLDDTSYGTPENAVALSAAVAATLLDVHAAGLAHGAVGAHAVVLAPDGGPMLADWGLDEHASPDGDAALWSELAELLAQRWCADSPADAAVLARAVNAAAGPGPGGGLSAALAVLTQPEQSPSEQSLSEQRPSEQTPSEQTPSAEKHPTPVEPPPVQAASVEPPLVEPAPATTPRAKPRSSPRHSAPEPPASAPPPEPEPAVQTSAAPRAQSPATTSSAPRPAPPSAPATSREPTPSRVQPAALAPPEAQRYVAPPVEQSPVEPAPPPPTPTPPPPTPRPKPTPRPTPRPVPRPESRPSAPEQLPPAGPPTDLTAPLPRVPTAPPVPPTLPYQSDPLPPIDDSASRTQSRSKPGLARPVLLTVLLTVILVTAVAIIIRPFDIKEPPAAAEPTGPMEVRAVSVEAQMNKSICVLVGTVTTNGQPGRLVYRWVGENGSQAVSSVSTPGYNYQVEIGLIWSPSSPPLHGSSVTLQILEPQPSTTSAVVPIGCI